ncbi:MAG: hypothetical protein HYY24_13620 [Verrucomicrobia bacterium]|nr:hypothetical protein [Verrucomicrobiota bacterium]
MRFQKLLSGGLALLALSCGSSACLGQWVTQTITLNPGWNAVFLEVQPAPDDCDSVLAGVPVESVWAWNRRFATVQFIQDPSQLVPGGPDWLAYLPADHAARATRNLFTLQGARAYLVKLKDGTQQTTWKVVGQPVTRQVEWIPNSYNLLGFNVASSGSPTFQNFFAGSPAHAGQRAFRLSAAGHWELIASPATTALRAGQAYWIFCQGASIFSGPMQPTLEDRDGLIYGRILTEQSVRIKNTSTSARSLTVQQLPSETPPDTTFPLLAGAVPLSYYKIDAANRQFGWIPFADPLQKLDLQPGEEWMLRFEVNRARMADFVPPQNHNGVLYQSVLEFSDDAGVRFLISVSAEGLKTFTPPAARAGLQRFGRAASGATPHPRAGLWVGSAVIERVSQPAKISAPDTPTAVGTPLQFRLLVHVDDSGKARLLQKVLQMFKPGTLKPDPTDPTKNIVDEPGRYVLVTDDAFIPRFSGATLRDGQAVGRRMSSAVFAFSQPILFSGEGEFGAGQLNCRADLGFDDPLNPFKHKFHPDHDNLDDRFSNKLAEGLESFSITRQIELEFTAEDPDNLTLAGWGDNQLGGHYRETISGLHNQTIFVAGTFRLTRASTIGVLNDGLGGL